MNSLVRRLSNIRTGSPSDQNPSHRQIIYRIDLIRHLVWRDFSLRYKQSVLGLLWSMVVPLAQLLVLVFLFQSVVPLNIDAYPAFVFTALLPWTWFSTSISSACHLFATNRDLVRRPNFSPLLLTLINALSNLLTYFAAIPLLVLMLIYYNIALTPALLFLPIVMMLQALFIIGLSMIVATLNVFYRDVQHIVNVILTLLFYLTPVFYRSEAVAERYHLLYTFSPFAVIIQGYRAIFFYGVAPSWGSLLFMTMSSIFICLLGLVVYTWHQHDIVDLI
jgi:lipopolysaccharide transport system permease protein